MRRFRHAGSLLALTMWVSLSPAQTAKPDPKPSPSAAAAGNSQSSQLPAGADTGLPGTSQKPSLSDNVTGDTTRRSVLRRRAAERAASGPRGGVDEGAAATAAARRAPKPGARASSAP